MQVGEEGRVQVGEEGRVQDDCQMHNQSVVKTH